jgi:hypothetical protein
MSHTGCNEADTRAKLIDPALHSARWVERVVEAQRSTHGEIHREPSAVRIGAGPPPIDGLRRVVRAMAAPAWAADCRDDRHPARTRLPLTLLLAALGGSAAAQTSLVVDIDTASDRGTVRDLFGVNRRPGFSARDSAATLSAANLYAAFGVSQVRTHDSGLDLCGTYTAASRTNTAVSPAQAVAGCELSGTGGIPTFNWTPLSSADADLSNPANYDFSGADTALGEIAAAGAAVYLRLGESYNGPNHTSDAVAWAKVAAHIYRHVIGAFKPTAGVAAVNPVFVEVHNEPDGGFWRGTAAEFHALFRETVARVRSAAAAAGRSVRIGGPGFTRSILTSSTVAGNPANGFVGAVGADSLDFYSAHHYGSCSTRHAVGVGELPALAAQPGRRPGRRRQADPRDRVEHRPGQPVRQRAVRRAAPAVVVQRRADADAGPGAATSRRRTSTAACRSWRCSTSPSPPARSASNPAAWAFWAHGRLRGATRLEAQVCQGSSCVAGHAAETLPVLALAARRDGADERAAHQRRQQPRRPTRCACAGWAPAPTPPCTRRPPARRTCPPPARRPRPMRQRCARRGLRHRAGRLPARLGRARLRVAAAPGAVAFGHRRRLPLPRIRRHADLRRHLMSKCGSATLLIPTRGAAAACRRLGALSGRPAAAGARRPQRRDAGPGPDERLAGHGRLFLTPMCCSRRGGRAIMSRC